MLAIGGTGGPEDTGTTANGVPLFFAYAAQLAGTSSPKICVVNTATGDDAGALVRTYSALAAMPARISHLQLFPMPNVTDPADLLLDQDVIFVGGGSVANLAAVWRAHGLDQVMREAWHAGVVLAGVSAGAICWFGGGTTDSFGPELQPFTDGLGMLPGSYCPHYNSEALRRPTYRKLVSDGTLAAGIACDDGAAAHFVDDELAEIVVDRPGAHGYQVQWADDGTATETVLPSITLAG